MAFPAVPEFSRLRQSFFGSADLVLFLCRGWTCLPPDEFSRWALLWCRSSSCSESKRYWQMSQMFRPRLF